MNYEAIIAGSKHYKSGEPFGAANIARDTSINDSTVAAGALRLMEQKGLITSRTNPNGGTKIYQRKSAVHNYLTDPWMPHPGPMNGPTQEWDRERYWRRRELWPAGRVD